MESLYDPADAVSLQEYMNSIGNITQNVEPWQIFYLSIARITGAATVGHLKMMRSNDIDMALGASSRPVQRIQVRAELLPRS